MSCPYVWHGDEGTSGCSLANVTGKEWQEMLEEMRLVKANRDGALELAAREYDRVKAELEIAVGALRAVNAAYCGIGDFEGTGENMVA